jgi:glycosyltransferase involved in cell wall biosynthesis
MANSAGSQASSDLSGASDQRVLIVLSTRDRRGAELEGVTLAHRLRAGQVAADVVALTDGTGALDDVPALGPGARSIRTLAALRRAARDASMVVAFGSRTLPACAVALAGTPTPFVYRSIGDPARWVRSTTHRLRTRLLFDRAEHVVALWDGAVDDIHRLYAIDRSRLDVIPNARDPFEYRPPTADERRAARAAWGHDDDRPLMITLGALTPEKHVDRAIEAMELLPDAQLLVVGDGPERDRLTAMAAAAPARNVTLLGAVRDPKQLLHAADVLLLTSRTEGMPGVIIEAGLSAVPAVATPVGAVTEMIDHGVSGIVLPSDAATAIAVGVRTALVDREQLGANAREAMATRFTWDAVTPLWLDVVASVTSRRSTGTSSTGTSSTDTPG